MWSVDALNDVASRWVELAWTVVWQSTILAAIVALVVLAFRRSSPEVRYWLWQMVAIKLLLMPFWTVAVPVLTDPDARPRPGGPVKDRQTGSLVADVGPEQTSAESRAVHWEQGIAAEVQEPVRARRPAPLGGSLALPDTPAAIDIPEHLRVRAVAPSPPATDFAAPDSHPAPPPTRQIRWQAWLGLFWLMIVAAQIARLLIQRIRLGRLLSSARPADPRLTVLVIEAAATLSLSRVPRAVLIDREASPFVCGVRRPVVAMPAVVREALAEGQLRQVLLHEVAHVKRRDLLWGWIPEIARTLYFFHPVAHWVCSRIRLERELACDRLAMTGSGANAGEYAETLVRAVSFGSRPVLLQTGAVHCGCSSQLSPFWKRRIAMLPSTRKCNPPRVRNWVSLAAIGVVIAAMPTLLAVSATAQPPEPIRSEPAASTTEEAPVIPEAAPGVEPPAPSASGRANNQPLIADPQAQPEQPEPAEEVPAEFRRRGPTEMRPEVLSWAAPAGSGPFMDIVTLANGYVEALGGIRTGEINLLRQQDLHKKGATSKFDVARVRADLENARMRAVLSRRIAQIARRDTQRELEWLEQQRRIYEALGETVVPKVRMLAIERDRDLAQGRLEMLESILSLED